MSLATSLSRNLKLAVCGAIANACVPFSVIGLYGPGLAHRVSAAFHRPAPKPYAASIPLSAKEAKRLHGKYGENPYIAGQNKWDVVYKGVNLISGNYSTTATDLSFQGGYGDPINVTRSYSANMVDEGPFGKGWSLSADVRQTAGGVLKKAGAPVRAVPTTFNERPALQLNDPNAVGENGTETAQPVAAVIATDATGKPETEQRDMDGVISTPPWDDNQNNAAYEFVSFQGSVYQVMVSCTTTTPDGTVYTYANEGSYVNGVIPFGSTATSGPYSNVLKVTKVVDRNGNTTTYNYGGQSGFGGQYSFVKSNGTTSEYLLSSVQMPGGQTLTFKWVAVTANGTAEARVGTVSDGQRTVTYAYEDPYGAALLTSVTSPAGRTTSYNYGQPYVSTSFSQYGLPSASNLLTQIIDPRGLTTSIFYTMAIGYVMPFGVEMGAPWTYEVIEPNGVQMGIFGNLLNFQGDVPNNFPLPTNYMAPNNEFRSFVEEVSGGVVGTFMSLECWAGSNPNDFYVCTYTQAGPEGPLYGFSNPTNCYWDENVYDGATQNLLTTITYNHPFGSAYHGAQPIDAARNMAYSNFSRETVETDTSYNYLGNPLAKKVTETAYAYPSGTLSTQAVRNSWYAYWPQAEYCQQRAVLANDGTVLSYTTYNPAGSSTGVGNTAAEYDAKYGGLGSVNVSSGSPPSGWYNFTPTGIPTATFGYDGKGRATSVYRLKSAAQNFYSLTTTAYGADGSGDWGLATSVIEDVGNSPNPLGQAYGNRQTTTKTYNYAGNATDVVGPTGEFTTAYDPDGLIENVYDVTTGQTVVTYTYGTTNLSINDGQPTQIVDGLTGVTQNITYDSTSTDGGYGQVASVSQNATGAGTGAYMVSYNYTSFGERQFSTYQTVNDTELWQYADFVQVGAGSSGKRAFQTLVKITGSPSNPEPTAEEEDYQYDTSGRVANAAFAQTPAAGYTPASGQRWYAQTEQPSSRCREFFDFDPAGRNLNLQYIWETFSPTSTSPTSVNNVTSWNYTYENSGQARGLKLTGSLYNGSGTSWNLDHTENYGYEAQRGFLTSAQYNDNQPNPNPTWTYDEGQNRTDTATNDLNQAGYFSGAGLWYGYTDLAGRLQTRGSDTLTWDCVSRLTQYNSAANGTANYEYRADGMRDHRVAPGSSVTNWSYYHDGQTSMEDEQIQNGNLTVTRYGLGARGIDECEQQTGTVVGGVHTLTSATSTWYPVFDGHGNQCGTLSRSGSNSYTLSNVRTFDAWGNVRRGSATGAPASRYCGSIGQVQDDESTLVYMRARFYDSALGRFTSQDPSMNGANWYVYCSNDPVDRVDQSGEQSVWQTILGWLGVVALVADVLCAIAAAVVESPMIFLILVVVLTIFVCADAANTFNTLLNIGKGILDAHGKAIEKAEKQAFEAITTMKTSGDPFEAIAGADLELMLYTAEAMNS